MAGSQNTTTLPMARLPRHTLEAIIEAALAELDHRDGDADCEPSEGDLDHLADDDTVHHLDAMEDRRHAA